MEFGIFQAATVGERPWDESEPQRIRNDIEMGVVADEAGFDAFWAPEHHCLESYSHNSSSHLSCLAVGLKTSNIRLVTGIFNLSLRPCLFSQPHQNFATNFRDLVCLMIIV